MEIKEKPRFESCRESAVKIIKADPEITQKELYEKAKSLYGEAAAMGIRQCFSDARRELKLICKPTRGRGIISKANRRRFQAAREQLLEEKATEALINNPNITPKELHKITTTEARNSWSKRTEPTVEHEVTRETSWNLIKEIVHENDKLLAKNQTQQEAIEFLRFYSLLVDSSSIIALLINRGLLCKSLYVLNWRGHLWV